MAESRSIKVLTELLHRPGNGFCADCGAQGPEWASYNLGIFICEQCAGMHRGMGAHISKVKSVKLDNWDEEQLQMMSTQGNLKAKEKYEKHVPPAYRRPMPKDPIVIREQWIRGKYMRNEFADPMKVKYFMGDMEGYLWKRGKSDTKFQKRRFLLIEKEGTLKYYNKEDPKADPKNILRLDHANVTLVPEKVGNPHAMQMTFEQDQYTRSIYVYAEEGQLLINWYTAIRNARLNRLRIAYPNASDQELIPMLSRDFIKEGWIYKKGPRQGDAYRKRWFSLDNRKLLYYEQPLNAFANGEIFLGPRNKGYVVREGVPPGTKDQAYSFTLKTPDRQFHFAAETEDERKEWMDVLKDVIQGPMSIQDTSSKMVP